MDWEQKIYDFKGKSKHGMLDEEVKQFVEENFENNNIPFNWDKYYNAMTGNTCMLYEGKIVNYFHDVVSGITCGLENRDLKPYEWD